jgi:hypothetical protein
MNKIYEAIMRHYLWPNMIGELEECVINARNVSDIKL